MSRAGSSTSTTGRDPSGGPSGGLEGASDPDDMFAVVGHRLTE